MAKIVDAMPSGESCWQSMPSADELPVSQEVIVPLPDTLMGYPYFQCLTCKLRLGKCKCDWKDDES